MLGFDPENVIDLRDTTQADKWSTFGSRETAERSELWSYLADEGSDVVVFYSGHGVPGIDDQRGYLLPVDANPSTAELNGYPIDVLFENLANLESARSVAVYLDACFSGGSGGGMLIEGASPAFVEASLPGKDAERLTVLTATSGKQLASWDRKAKHELFTLHLLEALYGKGDQDADGRVTAREAKAYLDRHMTRAAKRTWKRRQKASLLGNVDAVLANAGTGGAFPPRPSLEGTGADRKTAAREILAEAVRAAREVEYESSRAKAFANIEEAQVKAGDIQGALATARGVEYESSRAKAFANIAEAQAKAGDIQGALATARGVEDESSRAKAFAVIAEAQAKAGDARGAVQSLSDARAAARGVKDESSRAWAFAVIAIAEAQAKAEDARGAAQSLSDARAAARGVEDESSRAWAFADIAETLVTLANDAPAASEQ